MLECSEEFLRSPIADAESSIRSSPEVVRCSEQPVDELPETPAIEQYVYSRVDLFGSLLFQKEALEMGYSAEVEALTESIFRAYTGALADTLDEFVRGLIWETCWRIALKFHSLDGFFNLMFEYKKEPVRQQYLNRLETIILERLSWALPLEEANREYPKVLRRQVDRLQTMIERQQKVVRSFRDVETEPDVLRGAIFLQISLDRLKDIRATELLLVDGDMDADERVATQTRLDRMLNESREDIQRRAERMAKKRPSRMIS